MDQSAVQTILNQIEQLPEAERLLLDQRLAERAEAEWRREAEAARRRKKCIARSVVRAGQAIELISIERRGRVIRQLVLMPDGKEEEEAIV